jgi:hypothetical protein
MATVQEPSLTKYHRTSSAKSRLSVDRHTANNCLMFLRNESHIDCTNTSRFVRYILVTSSPLLYTFMPNRTVRHSSSCQNDHTNLRLSCAAAGFLCSVKCTNSVRAGSNGTATISTSRFLTYKTRNRTRKILCAIRPARIMQLLLWQDGFEISSMGPIFTVLRFDVSPIITEAGV